MEIIKEVLKLKFKTKEMNDHQLEITVEIEPKKFEEFKRRAARKISSQTKIAGFRSGKAPYDVVKRLYGDDAIIEEAIELSIHDVYPKVIQESELKPFGPGSLDEVLKKDPPKFRFIVPLEPIVDLKNYLDIRHSYDLPEISNDDINKVIDNLQLNYSTAKEKSEKSVIGDLVAVKMDAVLIEPDEGQEAEILKASPHQVVIGKDDEDTSYPFPHFSKKLTGREKGSEFEFTHKYSKNSGFEKLQNKTANFKVLIDNVKELEKPELNDDFSKMVGFESMEKLKNSIQDQLKTSGKEEFDNKYFDEVLEKIIQGAEIKYPPQMLDNEITDVLRNFEVELAGRNMDLPTYLKLNKREKEEFVEKEIEPAAKKRLEQALVIENISKLENIELDQAELQEEYSRSIIQLQADPNFNKLRKEFTIKKLSDVTAMQSATRLMNRRTLEKIKAIANDEIVKETIEEEKPALPTPEEEKPTESKSKEAKTPELKENSNKNLIHKD